MVEERKKKVQIEEDARLAKEKEEKHIEEVRILNKGYDRLFEAKYETDTLWESTTRPPANSLRLSRFFGRTATSTKGMKKQEVAEIEQKKKKDAFKKRIKKSKKEKEKVKNMSPEERKKYMDKQRRKAAKEKAKQEKAAALEVEKAKKKAEKRKKWLPKEDNRNLDKIVFQTRAPARQ